MAASRWRSIGFDLPERASRTTDYSTVPAMRVLAALQAEIDERGAVARQLLKVEFNLGHGGARVALREQPLPEDYPSLATVFGEIARACAQDHIGADQLRSITFEKDEVRLMLINGHGEPEAYIFPVRPNEVS